MQSEQCISAYALNHLREPLARPLVQLDGRKQFRSHPLLGQLVEDLRQPLGRRFVQRRLRDVVELATVD